jgi:hypothetical protein
MSEGGVDLSQIRGDWKFHMDYLTNAITQTMKRQLSLWSQLKSQAADEGIDKAMARQKALWDKLNEDADTNGTIPTTDTDCTDFIAICRDAKGLCDEFQDGDDSLLAEEFTEACRQTRALCDDLEMMKGQRPNDA